MESSSVSRCHYRRNPDKSEQGTTVQESEEDVQQQDESELTLIDCEMAKSLYHPHLGVGFCPGAGVRLGRTVCLVPECGPGGLHRGGL